MAPAKGHQQNLFTQFWWSYIDIEVEGLVLHHCTCFWWWFSFCWLSVSYSFTQFPVEFLCSKVVSSIKFPKPATPQSMSVTWFFLNFWFTCNLQVRSSKYSKLRSDLQTWNFGPCGGAFLWALRHVTWAQWATEFLQVPISWPRGRPSVPQAISLCETMGELVALIWSPNCARTSYAKRCSQTEQQRIWELV
jgi:hypothetical protein